MAISFKRWAPFLTIQLALSTLPQVMPAPRTQGRTIDRVAAIVNDEVITLTDVEWLIRYRGFQVPETPEERDGFYLEVLDSIINQVLIKKETARTPFIAVKEEEVNAFLNIYRLRFPGTAFSKKLKEMDMLESDLKGLISRQLAVNKFIELRFEPFVIAMPDEITHYYQSEYLPLLEASSQTIPPLSLVEETIRQILTVRKSTEYLERWIRDARQSNSITVLLSRLPERSPNLPRELIDSNLHFSQSDYGGGEDIQRFHHLATQPW